MTMPIRQVRDEVQKAVKRSPPRSEIGLGFSLSVMPMTAHDKLESMERYSSENRRNNWLSEVLQRTGLFSRDGEYVEATDERD